MAWETVVSYTEGNEVLPTTTKNLQVGAIRIYRDDGSVRRFIGSSYRGIKFLLDPVKIVGPWESDNSNETLTEIHDASNTLTGYEYRDLEQEAVWRFDSAGRLLTHTQRNGWTMHFTHTANGLIASATNHFGRSAQFNYLSEGNTSVTTPSGGTVYYTFDNLGRIHGVRAPDNSVKRYVYEDGRFPSAVTGIFDEAGNRLTTYAYDDQGRAVLSTLALNADKTTILYPTYTGGPTGIVDGLGTLRNYGYQVTSGRLAVVNSSAPSLEGSEDASSRVQDPNGLITSETDFRGVATQYTWDAPRHLPRTISEAAGTTDERVTTYQWHSSLRLPTRVTEPRRSTTSTYDSQGNRLSLTVTDTGVTPEVARTWHRSYNTQGMVATSTEPNGAVTSYMYNSAGNLTQATNALGQIDSYSYDAAGRAISYVSASGLATTYQYDLRGRLTRLQRGDDVTVYTYRPTGQVATASTPPGYVVTYQYDAAHRLTGWSDNRGASASYTLDNMGNRVNEVVANAQGQTAWELARTINSLNRVETITIGTPGTGSLASTRHGYDANADLISTTQTVAGAEQTTTLGLDSLRRVKTITNAQSASAAFVYNAQDAITQAKDFKNVATNYTRDALGNAKREATPDNGTTNTTYDSLGLPQQITDALGRATGITRDLLGRPTQITSSQGSVSRTSVLRYDLPGADYNALGAPQASIGSLSEIQDTGVTTRYQRDLLGRVTQKVQVLAGGDTRTLTYTYVPAGNGGVGQIATITYPSGKQLTHQYDSTGQLTGLQWNGQPLLTGITWNPLGQPTGWQWPGIAQSQSNSAALSEQRSYTTAGQLVSSALLALTWDSAGRIGQISQRHMLPGASGTTAQQAILTSAYTYDVTGRLTASAHNAPPSLTLPAGYALSDTIGANATGYAWDANGNRTQVHYSSTTPAGTATLQRVYQTASGSNRLQGYTQTLQTPGNTAQNSTATYTQDASGALVKKGDNHLHYGPDGRIAQASLNADPAHPLAMRYTYNALGQRIVKSDARLSGSTNTPITQQTVYAEDDIGSTVLGQYGNRRSTSSPAPAGEMDSTEVIYLPTASGPMPVAAQINGRLYAVSTDHLNTPRRLTNAQGQVAWQWLITGFGETNPTTGATKYTQNGQGSASYAEAVRFDLRYPGQVWDEETGLAYNLHRYYDAATGRYIQVDPIGLDGGWNRFGYVGGDPLSFVDPEGLRNIGPPAHGTYYPRGRPPQPIARSNLPARAAYEAAANMTATPNPSYPGDPLDLPCIQWNCSSSTTCGPRDIKRSNDFIPPAQSTADAPAGCRCVAAGRDPAFQLPFDPAIDPYGNASDVRDNWRAGTRWMRR